MKKSESLRVVLLGGFGIALIVFLVLVFIGQQTAKRLEVQAINTANSLATSVQATMQASGTQSIQTAAAQATQVMATVNAQATAKIEGTKQIDLNLFPNREIKVAVHVPLSGAEAERGRDVLEGAQLALSQRSSSLVNLGFNVSIVPYDDQGNPDIGLENARQTVRDSSVLCVVGPIFSSIAVFASEEYHTAGLAMVSPLATREELTERGYTEVNRIIGREDRQGIAAAQYAHSQGIASVYIVYPSFTQNNADEFRKTAEALGMNILGNQLAEQDEQLVALAEQIASLNPDAVYFTGAYDKAAFFFSQLRAKGYLGLLIGTDWLDDPQFLQLGGSSLKAGKGVIYTTLIDSYNSTSVFPFVQSFAQDFEMYLGHPPKTVAFAMRGYEAMAICLQAIENTIRQKGNIVMRDDIAKAIRSLRDFQGVGRTISFDEKGDLMYADYLVYQVTAPAPNLWRTNSFLGAVQISTAP